MVSPTLLGLWCVISWREGQSCGLFGVGYIKSPSYVRLLNQNMPRRLWKAVSLVHSGQIQLRSWLLLTANTSENNLKFLGLLTLMLREGGKSMWNMFSVAACTD